MMLLRFLKYAKILMFLLTISLLPAQESHLTNNGQIDNDYSFTPLKLSPEWWEKYEKLDNKTLSKELLEFKSNLKRINNSAEAKTRVDTIIQLVDVYLQKRTMKKPLLEYRNDLKKTYDAKSILSLIRHFDLISSQIELHETIVEEIIQKIDTLQKRIENIKLVYFKNKILNNKKFLDGLDLIESQLLLSIERLNQKASKREAARKVEIFKSIITEIAYAKKHVTVSRERLVEAQKNIILAQQYIENYEKKLKHYREEELLAQSVNDVFSQDKFFLSLNIMKIKGQINIEKTKIAYERAILFLSDLKKGEDKSVFTKYYKNYKKLQEELEKISTWVEDTEDRIKREVVTFQKQAKMLNSKQEFKKFIKKQEILLTKTLEVGDKLDEEIKKLELILSVLNQRLIYVSSSTQVLLEKSYDIFKSALISFIFWLGSTLFQINGTPITPFGLLGFIFTLLFGWFASKFISTVITKVASKKRGGIQQSLAKSLQRIIRFIVLSIAFLIGISNLGVDITKLTILISALSIGIGFGLQTIISNFVSGIILMFERSMKVGDYIELSNGARGYVQEINIRSTIVNTNDNIDIVVPNSEFINGNVINWTMKNKIIRLKIPFSVSYDTNIELLIESIQEMAKALPYTLNAKNYMPQVRLNQFGNSSLDFELIVWIKPEYVNQLGSIKSEYNLSILATLKENR